MLHVIGSMRKIQLASSEAELMALRASAEKGGAKLELETKGNFLYGRSIFLGYDLPNGNGDAIPSFYAGDFGPSFVGKHLDYEHKEDQENMIGKIMATWHVERELPIGEGPRVIGRNSYGRDIDGRPQIFRMLASQGQQIQASLKELQVEGIWRIDRNHKMGDIVARRLLSGEMDSVSQEASTSHCLCSVCGHKIQFPFDPICDHLANGSLMVRSWQVKGYDEEVLGYKVHHDPVGTGLGVVQVPAFDRAKVAEITAALKSGQMSYEAALAIVREHERMMGEEVNRPLITAAMRDFTLVAKDKLKAKTVITAAEYEDAFKIGNFLTDGGQAAKDAGRTADSAATDAFDGDVDKAIKKTDKVRKQLGEAEDAIESAEDVAEEIEGSKKVKANPANDQIAQATEGAYFLMDTGVEPTSAAKAAALDAGIPAGSPEMQAFVDGFINGIKGSGSKGRFEVMQLVEGGPWHVVEHGPQNKMTPFYGPFDTEEEAELKLENMMTASKKMKAGIKDVTDEEIKQMSEAEIDLLEVEREREAKAKKKVKASDKKDIYEFRKAALMQGLTPTAIKNVGAGADVDAFQEFSFDYRAEGGEVKVRTDGDMIIMTTPDGTSDDISLDGFKNYIKASGGLGDIDDDPAMGAEEIDGFRDDDAHPFVVWNFYDEMPAFPHSFATVAEALAAAQEKMKGWEAQGYYKTPYGRIPYADLRVEVLYEGEVDGDDSGLVLGVVDDRNPNGGFVSRDRVTADQKPLIKPPKKAKSEYDEAALAAGIKVEMEHTTDEALAANIAMNHLDEDPKYYEKLKKVEGANKGFIADIDITEDGAYDLAHAGLGLTVEFDGEHIARIPIRSEKQRQALAGWMKANGWESPESQGDYPEIFGPPKWSGTKGSLLQVIKATMPQAGDDSEALTKKVHTAAVIEARLNRETRSLVRHAFLATVSEAPEDRLAPTATRIRVLVAAQRALDASKAAMATATKLTIPTGAGEGAIPAWCVIASMDGLKMARVGSPLFESLRIEAERAMPSILGFHARMTSALTATLKGNHSFGQSADVQAAKADFDEFIRKAEAERQKPESFGAKAVSAAAKRFIDSLEILVKAEMKTGFKLSVLASADAILGKQSPAFAARRLRLPKEASATILASAGDNRKAIQAFASATIEHLRKVEKDAVVALAASESNSAEMQSKLDAIRLLARNAFNFEGSLRQEMLAYTTKLSVKATNTLAAERTAALGRTLLASWNTEFDQDPSINVRTFAPRIAKKLGASLLSVITAGRRLQAAGGMWPWTSQNTGGAETWPQFIEARSDEELEQIVGEWSERLPKAVGTEAKLAIESNVRRLQSVLEARKQAKGCQAKLVGSPDPLGCYWTVRASDGTILMRLPIRRILGSKRSDIALKWATSEEYGQKLAATIASFGIKTIEASLKPQAFDRNKPVGPSNYGPGKGWKPEMGRLSPKEKATLDRWDTLSGQMFGKPVRDLDLDELERFWERRDREHPELAGSKKIKASEWSDRMKTHGILLGNGSWKDLLFEVRLGKQSGIPDVYVFVKANPKDKYPVNDPVGTFQLWDNDDFIGAVFGVLKSAGYNGETFGRAELGMQGDDHIVLEPPTGSGFDEFAESKGWVNREKTSRRGYRGQVDKSKARILQGPSELRSMKYIGDGLYDEFMAANPGFDEWADVYLVRLPGGKEAIVPVDKMKVGEAAVEKCAVCRKEIDPSKGEVFTSKTGRSMCRDCAKKAFDKEYADKDAAERARYAPKKKPKLGASKIKGSRVFQVYELQKDGSKGGDWGEHKTIELARKAVAKAQRQDPDADIRIDELEYDGEDVDVIGEVPIQASKVKAAATVTSYDSVVTYESAEEGDIDHDLSDGPEDGNVYEIDADDIESAGSLPAAVAEYLDREGVSQASSSNFHPGVWYETEGSEDYKTGANTTTSYHLDGLTDEEEKEVWNLMKIGPKVEGSIKAARNAFNEITGEDVTIISGPATAGSFEQTDNSLFESYMAHSTRNSEADQVYLIEDQVGERSLIGQEDLADIQGA